ncbi:MAG: hypothetical protein WCD12_07730 [Candidatus Binatus sp.]|uniref:hypothetical protein n=1 Tax=Candidatus Binatus sp. TaxID=2811406 RepID=UPI003C78D4AA
MRKTISMAIIALFSTALTGCWFYTRPDTSSGCQKTTYGVVTATSTSENCPPATSADTPPSPSNIPPGPPPIPSPGTL